MAGDPQSLRKQFISWAQFHLPEFICLLAEAALRDNLAGEGRGFVNLSRFESIIADVADCVLIFPESAGSFAETGFFSGTKIKEKTLVVNPLLLQTEDSFLNLGPINTINGISFLQPTVFINTGETLDFAPIKKRLLDRVKWPEQRERLHFRKFSEFSFREKLIIVFELLRLLRLADLKTLRYAVKACFDGNPTHHEFKHLIRILLAAQYVEREGEYFKTVGDIALAEFDHFDGAALSAQVMFFYQRHSQDLYRALLRARQ
jgi:hypothetical protein